MSSGEPAFAKIHGESKALVLINEFQMGVPLPELQALLNSLVLSDLERIGILELVRRQAARLNLSPEDIARLCGGLSSQQIVATPTPAAFPAPGGGAVMPDSPASPEQTIRLRRFDAPPAAQPRPAPQPPLEPQAAPAPAAFRSLVAPTPGDGGGGGGGGGGAFYGGEISGFGTQIMRRMAGCKILLVDDDTRIRMVFRKKLEDNKFVVEEASDGEEAWKKIQENQFGVAVMDMKMPGLHGLELLARLTAAGATLPVVICSAYEQLQDEFVVSTYPKLRYLVKPIPADKLLEAVKELMPA